MFVFSFFIHVVVFYTPFLLHIWFVVAFVCCHRVEAEINLRHVAGHRATKRDEQRQTTIHTHPHIRTKTVQRSQWQRTVPNMLPADCLAKSSSISRTHTKHKALASLIFILFMVLVLLAHNAMILFLCLLEQHKFHCLWINKVFFYSLMHIVGLWEAGDLSKRCELSDWSIQYNLHTVRRHC